MLIYLFFFISIILTLQESQAQTNCNKYREIAKNLYDKGHFEESESTIKSCIDNYKTIAVTVFTFTILFGFKQYEIGNLLH